MSFKYFFWTLLIVSCGYALWRGRKYEQLSAIIFITASILSVIARSAVTRPYVGVQVSDLVIDTFVLVSMLVIALRSDRFWPLWIAGLQLTIGMSHMLKAFSPDLLPLAYAAAERFWSYPTLIILFVGAWRQHNRTLAEERHSLAAARLRPTGLASHIRATHERSPWPASDRITSTEPRTGPASGAATQSPPP